MQTVARISNADIRITLYGFRGDSGPNEVEQTNSGVSNAVCNGSTIEWERHKKFEDMSDDKIASLRLLKSTTELKSRVTGKMHGQ